MPTYKGIEMPANNADKIGAMIESAKNRLMGTPVGDFVRGVGEMGGIPKTIVAGTQNSYGANIPTVEGLKQNLTASVEQGNIAGDLGAGVSRIANNVNTPTAPAIGAAINQPLINMVREGVKSTPAPAPVAGSSLSDKPVSRPEGDENFFRGGTTFQPSLGVTGGGMSDKDLADWKERGRLMDGFGATEKNPNDRKFSDLISELASVSSTGEPSVARATKINALKTGIQALAPQTSFGQFGIAGLQAETARRGQDITAETAKGLQGIYKDKNAMDALYHSGLLELGKEKIGIEKLKVDAKTPENFLKLATTIAPKIKSVDPATGNEIETHDLQAGIKMLTASGFETPKGFKASMNGGPSLQDFLAAAKKKGTKMTDEQLTQYYNENYNKGR